MEAYWKVKVAIVRGDNAYMNTKDLGFITLEQAKELGEKAARDAYYLVCEAFELPNWIDCAFDLYDDLDQEEMRTLTDEECDHVDAYFKQIQDRYLSWTIEEAE